MGIGPCSRELGVNHTAWGKHGAEVVRPLTQHECASLSPIRQTVTLSICTRRPMRPPRAVEKATLTSRKYHVNGNIISQFKAMDTSLPRHLK
jgi:hypothetical protein